MLTLNCSRRQGLFGAEQRALLQRLLPHLQNAYGLRRRLSWVDSERRSMRAALDHLRFGVLLIDAEGHLRVANTAAVKLLAGQLDPGTGIARLPGLDASSRKALHAAVAEVLNPVASRNLRTRIFLRAADATTGGLVAVIASLHAAAFADFDVNGARVAIFLHPVKANAPSDEGDQWLAQAYGLSPVQVRLTRLLCEGLDLEQCAIALNNRMPTVRTQLKAIYAKTGVRRQAELVAMLGGLLRT
jgi:DNA-binding CsgD family transcriptional regulator